jgi:hypothetical protein
VIAALIVGVLTLLGPVDQKGPAPSEPLQDVNQFLLSMYPELRAYALDIEMHPGPAGMEVVVKDVSGRKTPADIVAAPRLIQATAVLDRNRRVQTFTASGFFLRETDNRALARSARLAVKDGRSPEHEAVLANARFGPGDGAGLLAHVTRALERRFGPFTIESADSTVTTTGDYGFVWTVKIMSSGPDGAPARHVLTFEPFEGRLVSLAVVR